MSSWVTRSSSGNGAGRRPSASSRRPAWKSASVCSSPSQSSGSRSVSKWLSITRRDVASGSIRSKSARTHASGSPGIRDGVEALLGRHEVAGVAGDDQHRDVRERADEHRILVPQHVVRPVGQVVDGDDVGRSLAAAERLRVVGVDEVEDAGRARLGAVDELVAAPLPLRAQRVPERLEGGLVARPPECDVAHPATSTTSSSLTSIIVLPSISTTHASRRTS